MLKYMKTKPECPYCGDFFLVRRHGKSRAKIQRYYCGNCKSTFQSKYIYTLKKNNQEDNAADNVKKQSATNHNKECLK